MRSAVDTVRLSEESDIYRFRVQEREFALDLASRVCLVADGLPSACTANGCLETTTAAGKDAAPCLGRGGSSGDSGVRTGRAPSEATRLNRQTELSDASMRREASLLRIAPQMRALDIGCGTGALTNVLAMRTNSVVGLGTCQAFLDLTARRQRKLPCAMSLTSLGTLMTPPRWVTSSISPSRSSYSSTCPPLLVTLSTSLDGCAAAGRWRLSTSMARDWNTLLHRWHCRGCVKRTLRRGNGSAATAWQVGSYTTTSRRRASPISA